MSRGDRREDIFLDDVDRHDFNLEQSGLVSGRAGAPPRLDAGGPAKWPTGTTAFGEWHHSDVRVVAYTFTYQMFNQMVTVGNLK